MVIMDPVVKNQLVISLPPVVTNSFILVNNQGLNAQHLESSTNCKTALSSSCNIELANQTLESIENETLAYNQHSRLSAIRKLNLSFPPILPAHPRLSRTVIHTMRPSII